jgi:hypothetical protein
MKSDGPDNELTALASVAYGFITFEVDEVRADIELPLIDRAAIIHKFPVEHRVMQLVTDRIWAHNRRVKFIYYSDWWIKERQVQQQRVKDELASRIDFGVQSVEFTLPPPPPVQLVSYTVEDRALTQKLGEKMIEGWSIDATD